MGSGGETYDLFSRPRVLRGHGGVGGRRTQVLTAIDGQSYPVNPYPLDVVKKSKAVVRCSFLHEPTYLDDEDN
jgi:hypothetical protein